ncbi:MAG: disulfide bond formation protein B [Alphaproteobacteria bacterium]|nr:MAG: disulfide bond formation protein B [Alphaproteobacteria bacterium]
MSRPSLPLCVLASPWLPLAAALASGALLAGAHGFQHWGGLLPCDLCLKQRPPHWAALGLGLGACVLLRGGHARAGAFVLALMGLILLTGAGVAAFHVGVEQHWWQGAGACAAPLLDGSDPAQMAAALMQAPIVRCDQVAWSLFGLSMAGYNLVASLVLGAAVLGAAWHWRAKERKHDQDRKA